MPLKKREGAGVEFREQPEHNCLPGYRYRARHPKGMVGLRLHVGWSNGCSSLPPVIELYPDFDSAYLNKAS